MSTDHATIEFLLDQLGRRAASFSTKRMFGEYCLYRDGRPVAFVCDDVLFVKDTAAGREVIGTVATPEFGPPYPGAKLYLRLAPDAWDDGDWLARVLDATADALPAPKPKPPTGIARTRTGTSSEKPAHAAAGKSARKVPPTGAKAKGVGISKDQAKPPRASK
jgi:TfoX/Sxy family transcriptional regulator of competence genes